MKEDLNFQGNQYNLLQTFFTCGYLVGQIPSQLLLTRSKFTIFPASSTAGSEIALTLYSPALDLPAHGGASVDYYHILFR
jgi:hypothetical protein